MTTNNNLALSDRRAARAACDASRNNLPVEVVQGDEAPHEEGEACYYTTPSGALCHYPGAYANAFGHPLYHPSTARVVVGRDWFTRQED